ncbi:conserved hypothetical protein [Paecilomyces variotii No. 5]|uniref:Uncharacterized protein n=1 Tax=Byssochlamys spectabilis (strain No. 5 / NBRC 109023) TaxID=1356009 RepID=V5GG11_BYSSN|nr:conserved hypothetical protein [Paecilomyces variotii No. 5]
MSASEEQHDAQPARPSERALPQQSLLSQGILSAEKRKAGDLGTGSRTDSYPRNPSDTGDERRPGSEGRYTTTTATSDTNSSVHNMVPASPSGGLSPIRSSASPSRARYPYTHPSSPGRSVETKSPSLRSPASQIFERNVQEDLMPAQTSPGIPSHIMTENHIPPILEASSVAITDKKLDPDSVEIVTHNVHQPAALAVAGASTAEQSLSSSWHEDAGQNTFEGADSASIYGTLDSSDVKRLSFISFADVVNAEQAENNEQVGTSDSSRTAGLNNASAALATQNRSPSPARSPVSSRGFGTSPPTSLSPSLKGQETSPHRASRGITSPLPIPHSPHSPFSGNFGGEVNVETMRQALRRTGSGDLSGVRSRALSMVDHDEGAFDRPVK